MDTLKLGFGRADFTPVPPVLLNSTTMGTEVINRLFVSCLAWQDESTTVLQYSMDLRNIYEPFYQKIAAAIAEKTGIPKDRQLLTMTHNHSAPDIGLMADEGIANWIDSIAIPAMCRAGMDALADLTPVDSAVGGKTETKKLGFVRRYLRADGTWAGIAAKKSDAPLVRAESPADPELRAVKISRQGKQAVVLVNFQAHAASGLGTHPNMIHSDFVGTLRSEIEKDGDVLCVYLQGACGNINCNARLPEDRIDWPDDCFKIGISMASFVKKALEEAKPLNLGAIRLKNEELTCTVNHAKTHLADKCREIQALTDKEEQKKMRAECGITSRFEVSAIIRRSAFGETRQMPLSSLVLGELAMGFAPVELFDTCGKQFRDASRYPMTFFCGYTNGSHSYMPSALAFPHEGYEALQCNYVPGTGEMIALKLAAMINK